LLLRYFGKLLPQQMSRLRDDAVNPVRPESEICRRSVVLADSRIPVPQPE
jgi:hypothetical protein